MNSGEREREREREKHARTHQSALFARTKLQSAPFAGTSAVDRDLRSRSHLRVGRDRRSASRDRNRRFTRSQSTLHEIAIGAKARSRSIAFAPITISRSVDRDLAKQSGASRDPNRRRGHQTGAREAPRRRTLSSVERQSGFCPCFLGLSFPCSIFQTPENIFRKIFGNTIKHMKTFSFPEILLHEPNTA